MNLSIRIVSIKEKSWWEHFYADYLSIIAMWFFEKRTKQTNKQIKNMAISEKVVDSKTNVVEFCKNW